MSLGLFLLVVTAMTNIVLVWVIVTAVRLRKTISTRYAQLQAVVVITLAGAGIVASIQDFGFHALRLGWINPATGGRFLGFVQGALVLGGLLVLSPVLLGLHRLTAEFGRTETVVESLVGVLPENVSLDTAGLTKREHEVVEVIRTGRSSDAQIADALFISPATAATHVRNIMKKVGVKKREQLALL